MLLSLVSGAPVYSAGMLVPDAERTICITGHREKNISPYGDNPLYRNITIQSVKLMLYRYIDMAVESGYTNFLSGLAMGTDLWAAEYILSKRKSNKKLRLFGAMPYLRHADFFSGEYRNILKKVEQEADFLVTVNDNPHIRYGSPSKGADYSKTLYRDRNYFMVDSAAAVIAFLNEENSISGTAQTVNYAGRTGKAVFRFGMKDIYSVIDSAGTDIRSIGREIAFIENKFRTGS